MISFLKKIITILVAILLILTSIGCSIVNNIDENIGVINQNYYTVTFEYNDDNNSTSNVNVEHNGILREPNIPTRTNYLFDGWYADKDFKNTYDFSKKVTSSFKIYAKWDIDYVTLTNTVTTSIMKANVTIINKSYNTFLLMETTSVTSTGSGIIFSLNSNNYYFVLTNNHVTVLQKGYSYQNFTVIDYLGNEYTATRFHQSAAYDLAVIYFKKNKELNVIERESENLDVNADIIALGQPKGQSNAITYGKISDYKKITLNNTESYASNVTFDVMAHDAPIAGGSSGGAILNLNLKIAGINYAASTNSNKEFLQGYAIPAEKINEYLNKYVFKTG